MSNYALLLKEHQQLLIARGYTTQGLSNADIKNYLQKDLERQFSKAYTSSSIEDEPTAFNIQAIGFFDDDKRVLKFQLHYLYEPLKHLLSITSLEISEGKLKRTISLTTSYDLPPAEKAPTLMNEYKQWMARRTANYIPVHASKQNKQRKGK